MLSKRAAWVVLGVKKAWLEELVHTTDERSVLVGGTELVFIEVPARSVMAAAPSRWGKDYGALPEISGTDLLKGYATKSDLAFETPTDAESEREREREVKR